MSIIVEHFLCDSEVVNMEFLRQVKKKNTILNQYFWITVKHRFTFLYFWLLYLKLVNCFFKFIFNFIIAKKKEDISGNLCPPVHYSHSPMKKNNNNSLVKIDNISTKKPVLSTPTKRTQTLVFFWFQVGLFLGKTL